MEAVVATAFASSARVFGREEIAISNIASLRAPVDERSFIIRGFRALPKPDLELASFISLAVNYRMQNCRVWTLA